MDRLLYTVELLNDHLKFSVIFFGLLRDCNISNFCYYDFTIYLINKARKFMH